MVKIDIKKRNLDYGIITWGANQDVEIKKLFNENTSINLSFNGILKKNKKVNYKYRRFNFSKIILNNYSTKNKIILNKVDNNIVLTFE